jgi:DNA-binding winged helix-turn-helix (wHTH) protein/pSer/pThr/pTyr-binding forkhead associated (FHA) protein
MTGEGPLVLARFGEFEIDEARFELRRVGRPVRVQPKVLDLLLYLVRHRDRVVTKEELFAGVWSGVTVAEGSLLQAISVARRLVGDSSESQRYIRTIRGRGFQFVADVVATSGAGLGAALAAATARPASAGDAGSISLELDVDTVENGRPSSIPLAPQLVVLLHADDAALGGARHSLANVDEVEIARGKKRSVDRVNEAITRRLVLRLPGEAVSRSHARIVRTHDAWYVVDGGSKNGTIVNGRRIERELLGDGDVIECGRTHLLFRAAVASPRDLPDDVDGAERGDVHSSLVPELVGRRHLLSRIARTDLAILVAGEAGTRKETVARDLHERSGREGAFVPVRCGAFARAGAETPFDEVFGEGSAAAGGTIFLDHVEDASPEAQATLVAALSRPSASAVRVMASSSVNLEERIAAGSFRRDLHTCLAGYVLVLPPLRERASDFGLLIGQLLSELGLGSATFDSEAARALISYAWPGNVRELRQCLASALTLSGGTRVTIDHLPVQVVRASP